MNSSMQEDDSFNLGHRGMFPQPLTVFSLWTKRLALLNEARQMARHPLCLHQLHRLGELGQ